MADEIKKAGASKSLTWGLRSPPAELKTQIESEALAATLPSEAAPIAIPVVPTGGWGASRPTESATENADAMAPALTPTSEAAPVAIPVVPTGGWSSSRPTATVSESAEPAVPASTPETPAAPAVQTQPPSVATNPPPRQKQGLPQKAINLAGRETVRQAAAKRQIGHSFNVAGFVAGLNVAEMVALEGTDSYKSLVAGNPAREKIAKEGNVWMLLDGNVKFGGRYVGNLPGEINFHIGAENEQSVTAVFAHPLPEDPLKKPGVAIQQTAEMLWNQVKNTAQAIPADADGFRQLDPAEGSVLITRSRKKVEGGAGIGRFFSFFDFVGTASASVSGSSEKRKIKLIERLDAGPGRHCYRISVVNEKDLVGSSFLGLRFGWNQTVSRSQLQGAIDDLARFSGLPDKLTDPVEDLATNSVMGFWGNIASRKFQILRQGELGIAKLSETDAVVEITGDNQDAIFNLLLHATPEESAEVLKQTQGIPLMHINSTRKWHETNRAIDFILSGAGFYESQKSEKLDTTIVHKVPGKADEKLNLQSASYTHSVGGNIPDILGYPRTSISARIDKTIKDDGAPVIEVPLQLNMSDMRLSARELRRIVKIAREFGQDWNPRDIEDEIHEKTGLLPGSLDASVLLRREEWHEMFSKSSSEIYQTAAEVMRDLDGVNEKQSSGLPPWGESVQAASEFETWTDESLSWMGNDKSRAPDERGSYAPNPGLQSNKQMAYSRRYGTRNVERDINVYRAVKLLVQHVEKARTQSREEAVESATDTFKMLASLDPLTLGVVMVTLRRISGAKVARFDLTTGYTGINFVGKTEVQLPPDYEARLRAKRAELKPEEVK